MSQSEEVDRLIREAATGARRLGPEDVRRIQEYVAPTGFDPQARERARGELAGFEWKGQLLVGSSMLPPVERHFIKHVLLRQEWPRETTLEQYCESIRQVILDPRSGIATRRYGATTWQLTVIRQCAEWRGQHGRDWILVDYRLETGFWQTAYQFDGSPDQLLTMKASDLRWHRRLP